MGLKKKSVRNMLAFWTFGVCNNFAYVVMLTAAKDILNKDEAQHHSGDDQCLPSIRRRECSPTSTGVVLICNILPCLLVKLVAPLFLHKIPYGVRHFVVCSTMALALVITACADTVPVALVGVLLVSFSSGLGETTLLGLTSHYSKQSLAAWSSGTGMAGISAAFSYAALTDPMLLALTPKQSILAMLVVPVIFALTFYFLLVRAETVSKVSIRKPSQWIDPKAKAIGTASYVSSNVDKEKAATQKDAEKQVDSDRPITEAELPPKKTIVLGLMRYMVPLFLVYFAEYTINQGLLELTVFDCHHGFSGSPASQYRWFQVLYQVGVFVSRSSINLIQLNYFAIVAMPILQVVNMVFLLFNAIYGFLPHFAVVAAIVLYEGLLGGGSYVNTFSYIHKKTDPRVREFALSTCTLADTIGIIAAAFLATPIHNAICAMPFFGEVQ